MQHHEILDAVKHIKKVHENIMVILGVLIGMILMVYFFTYALLMDKAFTTWVWVELITTILLVFVLIFLSRISFFLTKLLLVRHSSCRPILKRMISTDLALKEPELLEKLNGTS